MSLTIADLITPFNRFLGDSSTNRISAQDRLDYMTEATIWLQEELKNDHQIKTYILPYVDTVNYYLVTTPLADLLSGADLRRQIGQNYISMTPKDSRELAEDISNQIVGDDSWAIQRSDNDVNIAINAVPTNRAIAIDTFSGGITNWVADTVNSDASNLLWDQNLFFQGNASLSFDVVVGQSGNLRATISSSLITLDLSTIVNTGVFLMNVYIPNNTNLADITSFTLQFGDDSSDYWTTTVTSDIDGSSFKVGWQTLAFQWATTTIVGSPTVNGSSINFFRIDMNFNSSFVSQQFFHYEFFRVARPENLTFYYVSFDVGTDSTGENPLLAFSSTTDVPFFSGKYDQYKQAVAHKAAAICFYNLRLPPYAQAEEKLATEALERARRIFPKSTAQPTKSFKVQGLNLGGRNVGRIRSLRSNSSSSTI